MSWSLPRLGWEFGTGQQSSALPPCPPLMFPRTFCLRVIIHRRLQLSVLVLRLGSPSLLNGEFRLRAILWTNKHTMTRYLAGGNSTINSEGNVTLNRPPSPNSWWVQVVVVRAQRIGPESSYDFGRSSTSTILPEWFDPDSHWVPLPIYRMMTTWANYGVGKNVLWAAFEITIEHYHNFKHAQCASLCELWFLLFRAWFVKKHSLLHADDAVSSHMGACTWTFRSGTVLWIRLKVSLLNDKFPKDRHLQSRK